MRDEFYQRIIAGLSGSLDADLFEHCACDLLREAYPTLAPIKGGSDSGMDGAIADGLVSHSQWYVRQLSMCCATSLAA